LDSQATPIVRMSTATLPTVKPYSFYVFLSDLTTGHSTSPFVLMEPQCSR
jgi:hypothetical protein